MAIKTFGKPMTLDAVKKQINKKTEWQKEIIQKKIVEIYVTGYQDEIRGLDFKPDMVIAYNVDLRTGVKGIDKMGSIKTDRPFISAYNMTYLNYKSAENVKYFMNDSQYERVSFDSYEVEYNDGFTVQGLFSNVAQNPILVRFVCLKFAHTN